MQEERCESLADRFQNGLSRRSFLKTLAALGVIVSLPESEALAFSSKAKGKIVVVGGGAAGISMAARLNRWLEEPDITIIDPCDRQYYQPGFTMIGGGIYQPDEVYKPQAACIPDGVKWIRDTVTAIDPDRQQISLQNDTEIAYDFLVLTPGLQLNFDQVEGISRETLGAGNAHCIYDFEGAQRTWEAIDRFACTGGKAIYTNTFTKLKCGGAPKKILLLTEHLCRKRGTREKATFEYFNADQKLYDVDFFAKRLYEIFDERRIAIYPTHRLRGIDTYSRRAYFDVISETKQECINESGDREWVSVKNSSPLTVDYDFMHFVPPMSAPDFIRESGLGYPESEQPGSWVMVDTATLVHKRYANIVSLGDCAGLPTSKTSAAVRMQVPIAARNLIALMEGKEPKEKYDGYTACPIITEYGKVLLCEFDYDKTPQPTIPFVDPAHEQWIAWILKKYILKPLYFYGMLPGYL